ncbi:MULTISPECIES: YqaA family protein [unclassified Vibrio]|uniref:YqaA family protein n=1 Tax=unclassified Vibrio TaxID=2614977 RepID=UPI0013616CE6|nr:MULTISPECIES: YqaA family protein [unclassified Vibrio]NAW59081.1 DedA family protein [Vibrio sp. V36_P2S2PM302]NAX20675.1 DedA family protein [Vibrio sp. V39_P1S14PM300]NAX24489.1 DedA family protein [Vibrio sp. V38_P2S17PM301]NAX31682.1 DedA family protein [Vibrio sp. V37_P2S8PM304]
MIEAFNAGFENMALWFSDSALWVLFFSGFLSATLLPGGSEAGLIVTLSLHQYAPGWVILTATLGNTLGGLTNYWLGWWLPNRTQDQKHGHKALYWLNKYGYWSLLLSWLPVVGDPLCLAAGWLRMRFVPSLILIFVGKALRYGALAAVYYGFF